MFREELEFFISNQERLVREHHGKVLVLKGKEVLGIYPDALTAYLEAQKDHPLGSFMIQRCLPGPDAYTVTITSIALSF